MMTDSTGQFAILGLIAVAGIILFSSVALRSSDPDHGTPMSETEQNLALVGLTMWTFGIPGFAAAGLKATTGKIVADLFAYTTFGKPMGTWEVYLANYYYGGLLNSLHLPLWAKIPVDIAAKPAFDQLVDFGTKGTPWSWEKYGYGVFMRGISYAVPGAMRPLARGYLSGFLYWLQQGNSAAQYYYV